MDVGLTDEGIAESHLLVECFIVADHLVIILKFLYNVNKLNIYLLLVHRINEGKSSLHDPSLNRINRPSVSTWPHTISGHLYIL